jgi:hypothetical protein
MAAEARAKILARLETMGHVLDRYQQATVKVPDRDLPDRHLKGKDVEIDFSSVCASQHLKGEE